jgi:uncharacterized protein with HEPN domain
MSDATRLADILERIDRIERATSEGQQSYLDSEVIQDAVIRNLEVIGEAAKSVSARVRLRFPAVPWSAMSRFRDLAIHHYGRVLSDEVWAIVVKDLPAIRRAIAKVTADESKKPKRR